MREHVWSPLILIYRELVHRQYLQVSDPRQVEEADVLLGYFVAEDPAGFHSFLSSEWSPSRCDERLAGWLATWLAGWLAGWLPPLSRRRPWKWPCRLIH